MAAPLIVSYSLEGDRYFDADGCSPDVAARRKAGADKLAARFDALMGPEAKRLNETLALRRRRDFERRFERPRFEIRSKKNGRRRARARRESPWTGRGATPRPRTWIFRGRETDAAIGVSAKTTRTGTKRRAQVAGLSDLRFTDTNRVPTQSGGPRGSPPAPRRTFRGGGDAAAAAARINPRRRSRDPDSDVLCRTRAREDVPGARTVVRPNAL